MPPSLTDWKIPGFARRSPKAGRAAEAEATAASYSRLALRLERDLASGERGRSVLVAAAEDDAIGVEAVTELAWYLAEELGHSVLLVDGTFGLRALSQAFGIGDEPGLMELLGVPTLDEAAVRRAARPTQHEAIFLLPRGHGDNGRLIPARSETIRQLLESACAAYDFVLVQGSVVDDTSRSVAFGAFVDAALLVAVEGSCSVKAIQRGRRLLNECGAERVGLVLTVANARQSPSGV
jgi:polysaccharide biosynthesis transport protein